jgi:hypothetical protein
MGASKNSQTGKRLGETPSAEFTRQHISWQNRQPASAGKKRKPDYVFPNANDLSLAMTPINGC